MTQDITVQKLIADHGSLRSHGETLIGFTADLRPADTTKLQDIRWTLTREAHQHLILDERYVQLPLENDPVAAVREKAAEMRQDAEQFRDHWTRHIGQWTVEMIETNWRAYGRSVRELVGRMNARLDREERELYPLLSPGPLSEIGRQGRNWAGEALLLRASLYRQ